MIAAQKTLHSCEKENEIVQINEEHCYFAGPPSALSVPDLTAVAHKEVVDDSVSTTWREGRRVVDLGILADALKQCTSCCQPLHLSSTVGETQQGLGGYLHVMCTNNDCGEKNYVPYGKRHKAPGTSKTMAFDVNTKLAMGEYKMICEIIITWYD